MQLYRHVVLFLAVLFITGCATHQHNLVAPEISVSHIALQEIGLLEQQWDITLRAFNPNDKKLNIKHLSYELLLDDKRFARGSSQQNIVLRANDSDVFTTQVATNLLHTVNQLRKLNIAAGKPVPYKIVGKVKVGMSPVAIPFTTTGEIPLPSW